MEKQRVYATTFGISYFDEHGLNDSPDNPTPPEHGGPWELLSTSSHFADRTLFFSDYGHRGDQRTSAGYAVTHVWTWGEVAS